MSFDYDVTTPTGKVRMNIPDKDAATAFWTDEEIQALLTQEGDNVKRATAAALEAMASNEAYVQKVVRLMDISTDGARVSSALLERADKLRAQADEEEAGEDGGALDVAEFGYDDFSRRERVAKEALRDG